MGTVGVAKFERTIGPTTLKVLRPESDHPIRQLTHA
jgi:hypothetical protein